MPGPGTIFAVFDAFPAADRIEVWNGIVYAFTEIPVPGTDPPDVVRVYAGRGLPGFYPWPDGSSRPRAVYVESALARLRRDNPGAYAALVQTVARQQGRASPAARPPLAVRTDLAALRSLARESDPPRRALLDLACDEIATLRPYLPTAGDTR
jgi:hypothetical protein